MKRTNPPRETQRITQANKNRTQKVIEKYHGKNDLLRTWELEPAKVQQSNHDYILELRKKVRNLRNLLLHRASPDATI